jgi:hypothetical protein
MAFRPYRSHRVIGFEAPHQSPLIPAPVVFEPAEPQKWEYRTVSIDLREDEPLDGAPLAALGAEGWLLAGILQPPVAGGASPRVTYYFVRSA